MFWTELMSLSPAWSDLQGEDSVVVSNPRVVLTHLQPADEIKKLIHTLK